LISDAVEVFITAKSRREGKETVVAANEIIRWTCRTISISTDDCRRTLIWNQGKYTKLLSLNWDVRRCQRTVGPPDSVYSTFYFRPFPVTTVCILWKVTSFVIHIEKPIQGASPQFDRITKVTGVVPFTTSRMRENTKTGAVEKWIFFNYCVSISSDLYVIKLFILWFFCLMWWKGQCWFPKS